MDHTKCPRCGAETPDAVLFQCVRCFTVYCRRCADTNEGRYCPKCGMSQRMVLAPRKNQSDCR